MDVRSALPTRPAVAVFGQLYTQRLTAVAISIMIEAPSHAEPG